MTRLKPIGIPQEDREEPHTKIIPERVQKLIDFTGKIMSNIHGLRLTIYYVKPRKK